MSERLVGVGLIGAGPVGLEVGRQLRSHGAEWGLELRGVAIKDPNKPRKLELPYTDVRSVLSDRKTKIIIDAAGGLEDARDRMLEAMNNEHSVVTPGKAAIATFAPLLFGAARSRGVDLKFEGAVGGGIPIVSPMLERIKVDRVRGIKGIVNGTTNWMLTQMARRGISFRTTKNQAISKGFAEADPTSDIDGTDAAYKLAILFMLGFNSWVDPKTISRRGIEDITPVDLDFAREFGYAAKLLAIAKRREDESVELRVTPALIRESHQLASVSDEFNAIYIDWEQGGPQMTWGRGAGGIATASAVLDDTSRAARNLEHGIDEPLTLDEEVQVANPGTVISEAYIRVELKNKPGSLEEMGRIFHRHNLNAENSLQRKRFAHIVRGEKVVPDIDTLSASEHRVFEAAVRDLKKSNRVVGTPTYIPFEE